MYVLIDLTNSRVIARHAVASALGALAYIQFANVDTLVTRCEENRDFSRFDAAELQSLYASAGGTAKLPAEYSATLRATRELVATATHLLLPYSEHALVAQMEKLDPSDTRPYAFNPRGHAPQRLTAWHVAPQRDRPRLGVCSTYNIRPLAPVAQQAPSHAPWDDPGAVTPRSNPHTTEEAEMSKKTEKPTKAAKPAKAPKAATATATAPAAKPVKAAKPAKPAKPKLEKIEANGVVRPRPGGKCAAVWDIADNLSKKAKAPAAAGDVMTEAVAAGLNPSNARAEYQRWRKFNGLVGRTKTAEPKPSKASKKKAAATA